MTDKDNNAIDEKAVWRVNRLVDLRTSIIETRAKLLALSDRPAPTYTRALVEIEIAIASLEQQERKLTQQYREDLLAHVQASEDDQ